MPNVHRSVVVGTRTSSDTKDRFAALAMRQGLTESALLALVIEKVVGANASDEVPIPSLLTLEAGRANDRLTLRLRPGDRALADARAATRRMKTASYLAMLVRTHVRGAPVMPPAEVDELRVVAGQLGALGRQLRALKSGPNAGVENAPGLAALVTDVGHVVESARESVASVVRMNLISWEAGNA
jgi:hypothetical protein